MQIQNWTITDSAGTVWAARCHCGYTMSCAKALITARPPRCKRCGASAAKPVQSLPITQLRAGPGQPFVPVDKPVDKMPSPQIADALFGVLGLAPVTLEKPKPKPAKVAKVKEPKPPKPPKVKAVPPPPPVKVKRIRREAPPVQPGPVEGTHWTVLSEVPSIERDNRPTVLARCGCGTERKVVWCSIWIGKSKSCGCLRAIALNAARRLKPCKVALPGMVYGEMAVQAEGPRQGRLRSVSCLCGICGTTRTIRVQDLRSYRAGNCSCAMAVRRDKETQRQRRDRMAMVTAARLEIQRLKRMDKLRGQIAHLQAQLGMLERLTPAATVAQ